VPDLDQKLGEYGALGAFGVKIDFAYMMNLVTRAAYDDLLILKKIRNDFAHKLEIKDFNSDGIRDRAMRLKRVDTHVAQQVGNPHVTLDVNAKPRITVQGYAERLTDPRKRYVLTAQLLTVLSIGWRFAKLSDASNLTGPTSPQFFPQAYAQTAPAGQS
jgi:hypothetical protein